ncbi:MAG: CDP-alcohol phosphatidyltransferase family protein [Anaerolineae bacterium]|jgi:CDP-diacylglycerol--glycerol-3-phosphate 3-phosphatidyltransferase|nr:CDP-alcohol phosphatidyltransferase family protein [Chloroflexota bacterium]
MFTDWLRRTFAGVIRAGARLFGRMGLSPNMLTVLGCLLQLCAGVLVALGHLALGGVVLAVTSVFDAFDGALAREQGGATRFGAFLDSSLDRFAEAGVLLGLAWYWMQLPGALEEMLIYVALVGSLMVSYTRARAEGLGVQCKDGLFTRVERTLVTVVGLITGWVGVLAWILAIGTVATAIYRMIAVYRSLGKEPLV